MLVMHLDVTVMLALVMHLDVTVRAQQGVCTEGKVTKVRQSFQDTAARYHHSWEFCLPSSGLGDDMA